MPSTQTATLKATLQGSSASATITVTPASATLGNLRVNVSELPIGVNADIRVTGPGGFSETITATRTLIDLAPGSYTVSAGEVRERVNGVETLYRGEANCDSGAAAVPASCAVEVRAGELAEVAVAYERVFGTGRLYVPGSSSVGAYDAGQLALSNDEPPAGLLEGVASAQGVALDRGGNLWVSNWNGNQLSKYDFSQPPTDPPTPAIVISGGLVNPTALAFDEDGSLWVTNRGNATVVKFSAEQLSASGNPTPAVFLMDDGSGNLSGPTGIAFDAQGRLWFTNAFSQSLYRYDDPSSLSGTTSASPDVIISSTITGTDTLDGPSGLAFDKDGNLWVSNQALNTLVKFTPEQLSASGTPTPDVTISGLAGPNGLAFDADGNLWVSNGGTVIKFVREQLAASGSPAPEVVLSGFVGIDLGFLAFNPPPENLPLAQQLGAE